MLPTLALANPESPALPALPGRAPAAAPAGLPGFALTLEAALPADTALAPTGQAVPALPGQALPVAGKALPPAGSGVRNPALPHGAAEPAALPVADDPGTTVLQPATTDSAADPVAEAVLSDLAALARQLPSPRAGTGDTAATPDPVLASAPPPDAGVTRGPLPIDTAWSGPLAAAPAATGTLPGEATGTGLETRVRPAVPAGVAAVPAAGAERAGATDPALPPVRDIPVSTGQAPATDAAAAAPRPLPDAAVAVPARRADPEPAPLRPNPVAGAGPTPGTPLTAASPAAPPPAPAIPLPVVDPGWGEALSERVLVMAGQKLSSAEIRLNPAELGPLRVEIRVEDGSAQVTFTAAQAPTREAIEQALPRLRELFANEGLNLTDASVGDDGPRQPKGDADAERGPRFATATEDAPEAEVTADAALAARNSPSSALVDTFA